MEYQNYDNFQCRVQILDSISISKLKKMEDKNSKLKDEKGLTESVRKVFKEDFAQKEKNISNLFSGNFSITKQQIEEIEKEELNLIKSIVELAENQTE